MMLQIKELERVFGYQLIFMTPTSLKERDGLFEFPMHCVWTRFRKALSEGLWSKCNFAIVFFSNTTQCWIEFNH